MNQNDTSAIGDAPTSNRLTYTVEEAAAALGISRGLAYEMVREGSIPSLRLGQRRILIPKAGLQSMLAIAAKLGAGHATNRR